jgi:redox-sensitive bicupin YhaK (pirin superfamily)
MASLQHLLHAKVSDLGDFEVLRALPAAARRSVGPFVFVDHFGPVQLPAGRGMDVRPHPHIGLATVTYLFEGEIVHRDSLGFVQPIRPGDINWMTAGRGIVHSERSPVDERARGARLFGMQIWVALPEAQEEAEPSFVHYAAATLPRLALPGVGAHVLIGQAFDARSPVVTASPTLYCALQFDDGARLAVPADDEERALYVVAGAIDVDGERVERGMLAVLTPGAVPNAVADGKATVMLLGGAPLGPRFVWWNFVSSRRERIEQAKADWSAQRMGSIEGETEFIPLPPPMKPVAHQAPL